MVKSPEPSGFYYPNRFALILLNALEEIMGRNGLNAVLNMGGLSHWITSPPPDNMEKSEFDFAYMSALNQALEEMYGRRGGRGLQLRLGRVLFAEGLANFGALVGASDLAFKVLPLSAKLKFGLPAVAKVFDSLSDQTSYVTDPGGDHYLYFIARCSMCWQRHTERPVCFIAAGILEEALRWVSGGRTFRVDEISCIAMGDETCSYAIMKEPIG
ncbi:MAG: 4-vinyl reductase [Anaerolineae bacterium]|nr:4-vinyl reductase [Anaerolineae bacterium]